MPESEPELVVERTVAPDERQDDYQFPAGFFNPEYWSDRQRDIWLHQERCRRQALRQQTETARLLYRGGAEA